MPNKKDIFHRPTEVEITKGRSPVRVKGAFLEAMESFNRNRQYIEIDGNMIPNEFFYTGKGETGRILTRSIAARKFMKHSGEHRDFEVRFPRYHNELDLIRHLRDERKVPVDIREERYDNVNSVPHNCWAYVPLIGTDKRKRRVPIIEVVKGAKLYAYSIRNNAPIIVTPYADSEKVALDGATVMIDVPSRTPKAGRYKFKEMGIPLVDNDRKYALSSTVVVEGHNCGFVLYHFGYKYVDDKEDSHQFTWDAHEIAGHYAMIDYYWNEEHNMIPLAMSQIPMPSQKLAEIADVLTYDTVVLTRESPQQKKRALYPLNRAEIQICLDAAVQKYGHNATLFCDTHRDGPLADYKWREM